MQFRVYTGSDGRSHIEEFTMSAADTFYFPTIEGEELMFRREPMPGRHNCPRRQFVVTLSGEAELGFGGGSTQRIRPGDICLMEDHTGQGHTTAVAKAPWLSIQIPVSLEAQIVP
ncbi:MAG: hypothetical protein O2967_21105 [Proteobacteria bacterium]|nr:hypothetical protein [Pseudomonadota bacterium]